MKAIVKAICTGAFASFVYWGAFGVFSRLLQASKWRFAVAIIAGGTFLFCYWLLKLKLKGNRRVALTMLIGILGLGPLFLLICGVVNGVMDMPNIDWRTAMVLVVSLINPYLYLGLALKLSAVPSLIITLVIGVILHIGNDRAGMGTAEGDEA